MARPRLVMKNPSEQAKWVSSVLDYKHITEAELARTLHISRAAVSLWTQDRAKINFSTVFTICVLFGLEDDPYQVYSRIANKKEEKNHDYKS